MKKNLLIFFALLAIALSSCNKWEEPEFVVPVYNGPAANHTIADIKAKHTSLGTGTQDSICRYDETFIVKAVVVSSDEGGNCYKYITVQDETGGMEISIDRTGLYNDFPVGQTVYIDCRGLIVGDYHNKYQIGWKYNGSVGRINANALGRYLHKDGLPDANHPFLKDPIVVSGTNQLSEEHTNCFVKLEHCTFDPKYNGQPLATNVMTMDREVTVGGATVIVRTSNYANFRSTTIDASKTYDLYGILTRYNSEYQLTLRTKDDIKLAYIPQEITVRELTFDENSLPSGSWTTYPNNNAWRYQVFNGNKFMYHDNTSSNCDDWLISPSINIENMTDVLLYLDHQNNVGGSPASYYEVYYSTTYNGGEFNESDWHAFSPNLFNFPSSFGYSNALNPAVIESQSFRIALRYHKNGTANGSRWAVRALKFIKFE